MAVVDRWHKSRPRPDEPLCAEHSSKTRPLAPAADHGKGKRWQVRYRDAHGDQKKENFDRKPDAEARDKIVGVELLRGTFVDPAKSKITFKEYAEDYRKARHWDLSTAERAEGYFRLHTYPVIGQRSLRELAQRPSLLQSWIAGLKLAPRTARVIITIVSGIFTAAMDDGLIARNPLAAKSVSRPKPDKDRVLPWTLEQVDAQAMALNGRYQVVPYLGVGTAARQGEIFGLDVEEDIDWLRRKIRIHRQVRLLGTKDLVFAPIKNDNQREVPLTETLSVKLAEHIRRVPPAEVTLSWKTPDGKPVTHTLLLTRSNGLAMHRTSFNANHWRPALRRAGIPATRRNGCHILRHTAASAWIAAGIEVTAVAEMLGDDPKTVYDVYSHLMPNRTDFIRRAMETFWHAEEPDGAKTRADVP